MLNKLNRTKASTQRSSRSARNQSLSDVEPAPHGSRAKAQPFCALTWVVKGGFSAQFQLVYTTWGEQ